MPKNTVVIDPKSRNQTVIDLKSKNQVVIDTKSKNIQPIGETTIYLETKTISVGQPIGLLLCLTYPQALTFTATRA